MKFYFLTCSFFKLSSDLSIYRGLSFSVYALKIRLIKVAYMQEFKISFARYNYRLKVYELLKNNNEEKLCSFHS